MNTLNKKTTWHYKWHEVLSFIVSTIFILVIIYYGIKYLIPWLWHYFWWPYALALIVIWLGIVAGVAFVLFVLASYFINFLIVNTVFILKSTFILIKDILLYPLILITESRTLFSRISPHFAAKLLVGLPNHRSVMILKSMDSNRKYYILLSNWGALLLIKLPSDDIVSLLEQMNCTQLSNILFGEQMTRQKEYWDFLRSIPSRFIEECQYCWSVNERRNLVTTMAAAGIKISLHDVNKPYASHGI